jgi:hypothetical protein
VRRQPTAFDARTDVGGQPDAAGIIKSLPFFCPAAEISLAKLTFF